MKTKDVRKAVQVVLSAAANTPTPAVSEQEFLRLVVGGFANGGIPYMAKVPIWVPDLRSDIPDLTRIWKSFQADLQALLEEGLSAADRKRIYASADKMILVPHTAGDGALKYQYVAGNLEAVVGHAMRLLLDPEKGYRDDFKQCQWRDCNESDGQQPQPVRTFFFVSERREAAAKAGKVTTGKLPDRYCCEDHMRAAHRARATEATLRRRKEQREAKLKVAAARVAKARVR